MDLCATPSAQLYYSQPASASFPIGYASCVDSATGEPLASCLAAASPCRFRAYETDASGSSASFVVCVAYNSTSQCDREFMTDCGVAAALGRDDSSSAGDSASSIALRHTSSSIGPVESDSSSSSSATASTKGVTVDAPMLVAIIAGSIIVLGSIFFMTFVVRNLRPGARASSGRKSDSDTDFVEAASSAGGDDLSPQHELSTIVLPMRPTLTLGSPRRASSTSVRLPSTPQTYAMDETPVIRFPSQASFFRGGSSVMTGRSVFSASVLDQGGAAVYAQRQLSSLFRPRASRSSSASVVQPIHSRTTAASIRITSPPQSLTGHSQPLYSWETPVAAASDSSDQMPSFRPARGRAESDTNWSIGPGTMIEDRLSDFSVSDQPTGLASRLSVALEAMPPPELPSSLDDVEALARSADSDNFFNSGCSLFSNDSDYYDETIRDQSTALYMVDGDDSDDDEREIEF